MPDTITDIIHRAEVRTERGIVSPAQTDCLTLIREYTVTSRAAYDLASRLASRAPGGVTAEEILAAAELPYRAEVEG